MNGSVRKHLAKLLASYEKRGEVAGALALAAVCIALSVALGLRGRGIAATHTEQVLDCHYAGSGAHAHDASCYDAAGNLVCPLVEREYHVHDDSCYTESRELVCGLEEHAHTEACYDEAGALVCGLEEHAHTDACYKITRELTCGKEETSETHTHGPGCFREVSVEDADSTDAAVVESAEKALAMPAQELEEDLKETDENGDERVLLTVAVKAPEGALPAGTTLELSKVERKEIERKIDAAVEKSSSVARIVDWIEAVDVAFVDAEGNRVQPGHKVELKVTSEAIRTAQHPVMARTLDEKAQAKYHKDCDAEVLDAVAKVNRLDEDLSTGNEDTLKVKTGLATTLVVLDAELTDAAEAAVEQAADGDAVPEADADGSMTFTGEAGGVKVTAVAPATAFEGDVELSVVSVLTEGVREQVEETVAQEGKKVSGYAAVDIAFTDGEGNEVAPAEPVSMSLTSDVVLNAEEPALVQVADETAVVEGAEVVNGYNESLVGGEDTLRFEGDGAGTYALVGLETITTQVITASGDTYDISVTYGPEAGIPAGAELAAREIATGTDEYESYRSQAAEALGEGEEAAEIGFARFFDVSILVDGTEVEPSAPVEVKIVNKGSSQPGDTNSLQIVHFASVGTEVIEPAVNESAGATTVTYQQDSFSVIGLVSDTNANTGWPTSTGQYVMVLKDGSNYYAVGHAGQLTKVRYFNGTIAFMGAGTTTLDYISDYSWHLMTQGNNITRWAISSDYFAGTGSAPEGVTFVDFFSSTCFSTGTARYLQMRDGKVWTNGWNPDTERYEPYTFSATNGNLSRVGLYDDAASTVIFAKVDSFEADDNETEHFSLVDVNELIDLWKNRMTQELEVDKTAEVYDYDNRIYHVDITASSGYYDINPDLYLEFVVDASRSMYFPATLDPVATYNGYQGLQSWFNTPGNVDTSQVYYFITDQGTDTVGGAANVFAVFYDGGKWRFADASYYHTQDSTMLGDGGGTYGNLIGNVANGNADRYYKGVLGQAGGIDPITLERLSRNQTFSGVLYTSPEKISGQPWNRLDYLRSSVIAAIDVLYAVNPNAKIGLTSFNSGAVRTGPYTSADKDKLVAAVNSIGVSGGTNHALGLQNAYNAYSSINIDNRDHKQTVLFVTDGAPKVNGESASDSWEKTENIASQIKALRDKYGDTTDLYTLGLSLQYVGSYNQRRLAGISSGDSYSYNAEDGAEVVDCIAQIIESVANKSSLKGKVTDVVDQAFYPVDINGNPISDGAWITLEGAVVDEESSNAAGHVTFDANTNCWKIDWADQVFEWPTTTEDEKVPSWHGRVYVKAKEDFLGGNGISTNSNGSQVEAEYFYRRNGSEYLEMPLSSDDENRVKSLTSPYVNVDELEFTSHETEWTVYLGTSVGPLEEIKKLWERIGVREVVSASGEDARRTGSMCYELSAESLQDGRDVIADRAEFLLTELSEMTPSMNNWSYLISRGWFTRTYSAYGHNAVGTVRVELSKAVAEGETDIATSPHATAVVGDGVERYVMRVTYTPNDAAVTNYHTGDYGTARPGNETDTIVRESEDVHVINVFAKKLQLQKVDMNTGSVLNTSSAAFTLYRESDGDDASAVEGLSPDKRYEVVSVLETKVSGAAAGKTDETEYLPLGNYWLVETKAPDGYLPAQPLQMTIDVTDDDDATVPVLKGAENNALYEKPIGWNWQQQAMINFKNATYAELSEGISAANSYDSTTSTVLYNIKNTSGVELPAAGGPGTAGLVAAGAALVLGAAAVLMARRRRASVA